MARINLLPWRETRRKEQQRQFLSMLGFAAALAAVLVMYVHFHMNGLIEHQERRNAYLENEIKIVDEKIKEIRKLESTRKALLERMNVIESLQATRPEVVHLFDEIVETLPEGTYLTSMKQNGNQLTLVGKAESNARVSAYMRNIDGSEWMDGAALSVIETGDSGPIRISDFTLRARQTAPKPPEKTD